MSNATIGYGAKFLREDDASPGTFVQVAEVTGLSGPSLAMDPVEVTHMASPSGFREFIPGLAEAGEVTVEMNFLPTDPSQNPDALGLAGDLIKRQVHKYQISFPTASGVNKVWGFDGMVTAWEVGTPVDDRQTASATIKISGIPTFSGL